MGPNVKTEHDILRHTFMLLSLTFGFGSITCLLSILAPFIFVSPAISFVIYPAILFLLHLNEKNIIGLILCFFLTGWLGFTLTSFLSFFLVINPFIVLNTLLLTCLLFVILGGYTTIVKDKFSYATAWAIVSVVTVCITWFFLLIFSLSATGLVLSSICVLMSAGIILWQLGHIIHNGETDYTSATTLIFVGIYDFFTFSFKFNK